MSHAPDPSIFLEGSGVVGDGEVPLERYLWAKLALQTRAFTLSDGRLALTHWPHC